MRFRKRISLLPGLKMNLSKSGISFSAGVRGLSYTMSDKGNYLNTGIPGTGIYDRQKISGGKKATDKSTVPRLSGGDSDVHCWELDKGEKMPEKEGIYRVMITDELKVVLEDCHGNIIEDENLLRIVKRQPMYREKMAAAKETLRERNAEEVRKRNESLTEFISIHRNSPKVLTEAEYLAELSNTKLKKYRRKKFLEVRKSEEELKEIAFAEAKERIQSWKIWTLKKEREAYVAERLPQLIKEYNSAFDDRRQAFELAEDNAEKAANSEYQTTYNNIKRNLQNIISGDEGIVDSQLSSILENIELPVNFNLDYDYKTGSDAMYVDLNLPPISELPAEKAAQLASGTLRMKARTQTELRADYVKLVFGLAIFFAAICFNVSPKIQTIVMSGCTDGRNTLGDLCNNYIYSLKFKRRVFEATDLGSVDPKPFCLSFENRCKLSDANNFKEITPYE